MPVPAFAMVTHSGTFGPAAAPVEIWSWSVKSFLPLAGANLQLAADAAQLAYVTSIAPLMPPPTILRKTRVSLHNGGTGRVQTNGEGQYAQADNLVPADGAGGGSTVYPLQVACCVSLLTPRAGARGRGRTFLPAPGQGLGADYRWAGSTVTAIADGFQSYLGDLRASSDGDDPIGLVPAVVSSFGFITAIDRVRVGRVPDTMRSRRGDLVEDYYEAAVG